MSANKRYLVLSLVNIGFLFVMFGYCVFMQYAFRQVEGTDTLGLVVYVVAAACFVALYAVSYGIFSYLYVKNIIFSQLIFLSALLVALLLMYTPDVSSASAVVQAIKGIIRLMGIFMPFSLVPSFITMLIVKLVERSRQNKLNAEQPWNYPPSYPPQQ